MRLKLKKNIIYIFLIVCISLPYSTINSHVIHDNKNKTQTSKSSSIIEEPCFRIHSIGKLVLGVSAVGFGSLGVPSYFDYKDCFTADYPMYKNSEYPKGSAVGMTSGISTSYGGIVDGDTLVTQSNYAEFRGVYSSSIRTKVESSYAYDKDAIGELEFSSATDDTTKITHEFISYNQYDTRPHKPLGIKVTSSSYSWSYEYADDFVLFDLTITNISDKTIEDFYFTFDTYDGTGYSNLLDIDGRGDILGYLPSYTIGTNCQIDDNISLMWIADGDGDPYENKFVQKLTRVGSEYFRSAPNVSGVFHLKDYTNFRSKAKTSYNWFASSSDDDDWFMPIARKSTKQSYLHKNAHLFGDNDRYSVMANNEIDYNQIHTASIGLVDPNWHYPNQNYAKDISDGFSPSRTSGNGLGHTHHLLSIGPFDLSPGAVLKIPYAYVAGENFHTIPSNGDNLPNFPKQYYRNLDFSDIVTNAQWARWIYDNPGVDTDGDGDSGRYQICVLDSLLVDGEWIAQATDTFWYRGDGVPDWRAAGPPPAPYIWLEPTLNGIRVRFNGSRSETEKDIFTRIADFEGYNIYFGRDERETSLSLVASYDKDNYDKFSYDFNYEKYSINEIPMTLEDIRCTYGNSCDDSLFDPLMTSRTEPLFWGDSLIFFEKHAFNVNESSITKVYPNARDPRLVHPDSLLDSDYTDDGYFKFFEYEYFIENLLSTISYWVNVTAFDFGSPKSGLKALESSKVLGIQEAYPHLHADDNSDERKQVFIYPNPYKINANYRKLGFEGRTEEDRPDYRVRELNFANLPPKCEIKIFSLDGDLIRHLSHNMPEGDPTNSRHRWDLITRNTQMIVSGLYYWTVEFPDGEVQMGKFVALM